MEKKAIIILKSSSDWSYCRKKILKSSPIHFVEKLPELWLDHGSNDRTVSVMQLKNLQDSLLARNQREARQIHILEGQGHQLGFHKDHIKWLLEW